MCVCAVWEERERELSEACPTVCVDDSARRQSGSELRASALGVHPLSDSGPRPSLQSDAPATLCLAACRSAPCHAVCERSLSYRPDVLAICPRAHGLWSDERARARLLAARFLLLARVEDSCARASRTPTDRRLFRTPVLKGTRLCGHPAPRTAVSCAHLLSGSSTSSTRPPSFSPTLRSTSRSTWVDDLQWLHPSTTTRTPARWMTFLSTP